MWGGGAGGGVVRLWNRWVELLQSFWVAFVLIPKEVFVPFTLIRHVLTSPFQAHMTRDMQGGAAEKKKKKHKKRKWPHPIAFFGLLSSP
jgi:hypothetical protein